MQEAAGVSYRPLPINDAGESEEMSQANGAMHLHQMRHQQFLALPLGLGKRVHAVMAPDGQELV